MNWEGLSHFRSRCRLKRFFPHLVEVVKVQELCPALPGHDGDDLGGLFVVVPGPLLLLLPPPGEGPAEEGPGEEVDHGDGQVDQLQEQQLEHGVHGGKHHGALIVRPRQGETLDTLCALLLSSLALC